LPVASVIAAIAALLVVPTALAVLGTYRYAAPYVGLVTASRMTAAVDC
jgi:acetyl esterase